MRMACGFATFKGREFERRCFPRPFGIGGDEDSSWLGSVSPSAIMRSLNTAISQTIQIGKNTAPRLQVPVSGCAIFS
jgi:hypothetical protein